MTISRLTMLYDESLDVTDRPLDLADTSPLQDFWVEICERSGFG